MNQVLNKVRDVDPNDSEAVKETLTSFFQNLSKNKEFSNNRWLRTVETVVNRFPKYCGAHRTTIENYIINFLDSNNYNNVIDAAKCAHALQQVKAPQEKGATPKSSWRDQMSSLCGAAHTLIDATYNQTNNIYKYNKVQKETQEPTSRLQAVLQDIDSVPNTKDKANKGEIICTRLRNVFVFIQAMLVEVYPVAKPIRPLIILEVILKALNSSGNENSNKVTTIKVEALKTLDALVACLGSNLIPFSTLVFRFIMQTFKWSSENPSEESRKVRCTAYNSLTKWLLVLHTYRSIETRSKWDEELTSHIVSDVTPPKHVMQLTPSTTSMKNLSKKARKRLANTMLKESNISSHMPGEKNKIEMSEESIDEIAIAALECAETFLTVCGLFLKPVIHKQFQELLVKECYNIQSYTADRGIWLLRGLEASRKCGGNVPPPTQYCLHLYSELVNSSEREISKFCTHALLDIRLHLHGSPPTLNYALEGSKNHTNKFTSQRNRAVLESLLGRERMPSMMNDEDEVISIPDEPVNKRPRTDDVTENISLSSDSGSSIQSNEVEIVIEDMHEHCDQLSEIDIEPVVVENDSDRDENDAPTQQNNDVVINADSNQQQSVTADIHNEDVSTNNDTCGSPVFDNIHEARTQLPVTPISNDIDRDKSPVSMEVTYDYPATMTDKVKVLEKTDDENLPSTNDTDDIQITCGQMPKGSQESVKINGDTTPECNGNATETEKENNEEKNLNKTNNEVSVEDMLADFVDEVNEENASPA